MDRKTIVLGGTVPFEEEGRGHPFTNERNEAEIQNLAGEDRGAFSEAGNDSFKLSTTVKCDNGPIDHQLECNTTSADELAKTEGEAVECQSSDSNSDKEDNDTKEVLPSVVYISNNLITSKLKEKFQHDTRVVHIDRNSLQEDIKEGNMLVGFTSSILENVFKVGPDIDVDLRRRTEVIAKEKKVRFFKMAPTGTPWRNGFHSICTVYKNVQTGDTIYVVHKDISNYREVLAGLDVQKISPAIFFVIEADDKKLQIFMELIDPYVNLCDMKHLGEKFGKKQNILFQKMGGKIIPRIIDYGSAQENDVNENDELDIEDDFCMTSQAISELCTSWDIDDQLLERFRGDNPKVLRNTEDLECLIDETAFEAAIFATQCANKNDELTKDIFKSIHKLTDSFQ